MCLVVVVFVVNRVIVFPIPLRLSLVKVYLGCDNIIVQLGPNPSQKNKTSVSDQR